MYFLFTVTHDMSQEKGGCQGVAEPNETQKSMSNTQQGRTWEWVNLMNP